jgi:tripartite-type tricarboxylate transporter receptor subunit TctC
MLKNRFVKPFLATTILSVAATLLSVGAASAQTYPTRQITMMVPFGAGGSTDIVGRITAQAMAKNLGVPVVVLNKGGAGGTLGTQQVTTMPPDGYTILMSTTSTLVVGPLTNETVKYHPINSFEHIGMIAETPYVLVVSNKSGITSVKDLIEIAKKNPGKLNYGSAGQGSTTHLAALMFLNATGVKMEHIPYSSNADSTKAVMADEVQVLFGSMPAVLAQIKAGSIKALAVGTTTRSAELPEIPTMQQAGVADYQASLWLGLSAPAKTPAAVLERLSKSLNEVISDPAVIKQLANTGAEAKKMSQPEFKKLITDEYALYKKIVEGMPK